MNPLVFVEMSAGFNGECLQKGVFRAWSSFLTYLEAGFG